MTTFGEHKGYALAFVCEMLAGALCGSGTMRPERQGRGTATNGMLTIVIDPSRLVDREWLAQEIAAMTDYITASPPARPDEPVLLPATPNAGPAPSVWPTACRSTTRPGANSPSLPAASMC